MEPNVLRGFSVPKQEIESFLEGHGGEFVSSWNDDTSEVMIDGQVRTPQGGFPQVISPAGPVRDVSYWLSWLTTHAEKLSCLALQHGVILFRGFHFFNHCY